ncbi:sterol desaturase family protein [Mesorhizobium sp. WSM4976]|uniref:sterol desaturase family protein n=1 Tax=Mesorhizobium sp. WSM4976 TaxID=3038549 RepID=UPI0024169597|nr:sterol desaturase family protein [Mesorhizobium sp. WSM4976]MDG4895312.1 sterol desaturase family protein [Mesorhizobium sp. WSM4976]
MEILNLKGLLITALIFVPIEHLFALRPNQKILRKAFFNDLIYAVFNNAPITIGLIATISAATKALSWLVPEFVSLAISSQPLWLQVVEIVLIADIGFYFAHRAFHAIPVLWNFHAIHHSIEDLDWLAGHRIHPVDQVLTKSASFIPVYLLGFTGESIAIFALIFHAHALLLHANVRLRIGPLRWLIASPQFHHWHHANERTAYNKNFAGQLSFLDVIFGTMYLPGKTVPERYGVDDPIPTNYIEQLAYPLVPKRKNSEAPSSGDA